MEYKTSTPLIALSLLVVSEAALSRSAFIEQARVIEAEPVYETVEVSYPVTECRMEPVTRNGRGYGSYIAPIAGGVIGGVLGHELGRKKRGETALTVAGTLLGATLGHEYRRSHSGYRPAVERIRRCETVEHHDEQQQLAGYRVKYRYDGHTFHTFTAEHPGRHIPVRVQVSPTSTF